MKKAEARRQQVEEERKAQELKQQDLDKRKEFWGWCEKNVFNDFPAHARFCVQQTMSLEDSPKAAQFCLDFNACKIMAAQKREAQQKKSKISGGFAPVNEDENEDDLDTYSDVDTDVDTDELPPLEPGPVIPREPKAETTQEDATQPATPAQTTTPSSGSTERAQQDKVETIAPRPAAQASSAAGSHSMSAGALTGIVLGTLFLVAAIGFVIYRTMFASGNKPVAAAQYVQRHLDAKYNVYGMSASNHAKLHAPGREPSMHTNPMHSTRTAPTFPAHISAGGPASPLNKPVRSPQGAPLSSPAVMRSPSPRENEPTRNPMLPPSNHGLQQ
jgi:hypothetical protein